MAKLFELNSDSEIKEISRNTRIYADSIIANEELQNFSANSNAPFQKIKFFLDAIKVVDGGQEFYYRVGKYFELEPLQTGQFITERGFFTFFYNSWKEQDGTYTFHFGWQNGNGLVPLQNTFDVESLYISNVNFEDSFYQWQNGGWLNTLKPGNIADKIVTQKLPGVRRMDLSYCRVYMRNSVPVTAPVTPPKDLNTYYQCYIDDFIEIGYWKPTAAINRIFVIPKGIQGIKPSEVIDEQNYRTYGHYDFELPVAQAPITATLVAATSLPVDERHPELVPITFDNAPFNLKTIHSNTNPALEPIGIPDEIGFSILINANNATKGKIMWEAKDGYTYSLSWEGATYNVNTANFAADIAFYYLGRNQTGKSPIPEGGI